MKKCYIAVGGLGCRNLKQFEKKTQANSDIKYIYMVKDRTIEPCLNDDDTIIQLAKKVEGNVIFTSQETIFEFINNKKLEDVFPVEFLKNEDEVDIIFISVSFGTLGSFVTDIAFKIRRLLKECYNLHKLNIRIIALSHDFYRNIFKDSEIEHFSCDTKRVIEHYMQLCSKENIDDVFELIVPYTDSIDVSKGELYKIIDMPVDKQRLLDKKYDYLTEDTSNSVAFLKETASKIDMKPYEGDEDYIFVSYAHKDRDEVVEIIGNMISLGYRVWYDEGIDPGTEWDENIALHVEKCKSLVAFISENYLNSENCKDELNYARDLNKERLLVYIEDVSLPSGMAMRLNRLQAVYKCRYKENSDFYDKFYSTSIFETCRFVGVSLPVLDEKKGNNIEDGYRIDEIIGSGGTGAVYKGFDCVNYLEVAIKKYDMDVAFSKPIFSNPDFLYAIKRITSPGVCKVLKVIRSDVPKVIMEYVEGVKLSEYIRDNVISFRESLSLIKQVLRALGAFHNENIFYGDVSPENINIKDGEIYLMDFDGANFNGSKYFDVTMSFDKYSSPERGQGATVDYRIDIYSTGILLDELTLKCLEFGSPITATIDKCIELTSDPLQIAIFKIIRKATQFHPDDRYQSVEEMISDIDALL